MPISTWSSLTNHITNRETIAFYFCFLEVNSGMVYPDFQTVRGCMLHVACRMLHTKPEMYCGSYINNVSMHIQKKICRLHIAKTKSILLWPFADSIHIAHSAFRAFYATCKMQDATKPSSTFFEIAVYYLRSCGVKPFSERVFVLISFRVFFGVAVFRTPQCPPLEGYSMLIFEKAASLLHRITTN